ncbi:hypothetical protein [Rhizobium halophytocola]|uniref:Uncharacterized protein n=1 Tax=Rhizobium halophytocola TaxID=735519 RepID=A0ABS4DSD8_9HYPH|nr:hypothetical protein [Rhizobium halophytocola]MBP1848608.1 hypothetical protein [Rhizobium halophytocola]
MPKIGGKSYPDKISDILKDKDLLEAFEKWAHARQPLAENMMMFIQTNMNIDRVYEHFLKVGAAHTVHTGLSNAQMDAFHKIAEDEDWKHKAWKALVAKLKAKFTKDLDQRFVPKFWTSAEFKTHHATQVETDIGSTSKVAKLLGVKDDDNLKNLMVAANMGSDRDMKKYSEAVLKQAKSDEAAKTFVGRMKKAMGL